MINGGSNKDRGLAIRRLAPIPGGSLARGSITAVSGEDLAGRIKVALVVRSRVFVIGNVPAAVGLVFGAGGGVDGLFDLIDVFVGPVQRDRFVPVR